MTAIFRVYQDGATILSDIAIATMRVLDDRRRQRLHRRCSPVPFNL